VNVIDIRKMIEDRIESTHPQNAILEFLAERQGQKVDKRLIAKLQESIDKSIKYIRGFPGTAIEWGGYGSNGGLMGGCLVLSYNTKNVMINTAFIEENNPPYFAGVKKRNEERRKALDKPEDIAKLEEAIEQFVEAARVIKSLCDYGNTFNADQYSIKEEIEKMTGVEF
jgi:hypothetical protein